MPFIELSKGYKVEVDEEDCELVQFIGKWYATSNKTIYAEKRLSSKQLEILNQYLIENNRNVVTKKTLMMHRLIMNANEHILIDHIDGNGLNNKKENLRFATRSQNAQNKARKNNSTSKYKGVHYAATEKNNLKKPWKSYIQNPHTNKKIQLGFFSTEEEAAKAYDEKALEIFGQFAKLNFPQI
jgi:hypothetical protein